MRVLLISRDFSGASLAQRLMREGHEVRAWLERPVSDRVMRGIVERIPDLEAGLAWAGMEGLILFDDIGLGSMQDDLRLRGYAVLGGSAGGDRLEYARQYAQDLFASLGVATVPCAHFPCPADAARWVRSHPGQWVIKQNGHADKGLCYVGKLEDGSDVLDLLEHYAAVSECRDLPIDLQQVVSGVEIGVGRYFNGGDWAGPIELNQEHKSLFTSGLGPKTWEMGTLMWFTRDEGNRLFREVLAPMTEHLRSIGFRGDMAVNCMVDEAGVHPLEATPRFGWPATQLQMELSLSPWGDFLMAVARGEESDLDVKEGYGVVVLMACPPFPYAGEDLPCRHSQMGLPIRFRLDLAPSDMSHIHFEGVELRRNEDEEWAYHIADSTGYVLHVTGSGPRVEDARSSAYGVLEKIIVPRSYWRKDIGLRFLERDQAALEKWGYL